MYFLSFRHPGSTPSQRQRRLYTSLAMAEEIDASRSSPRASTPTRPIIPQPAKVTAPCVTKNVFFLYGNAGLYQSLSDFGLLQLP